MKEFKLDNNPKISPGFSVPENYFENFSSKLLQEEKSPVIKIPVINTIFFILK